MSNVPGFYGQVRHVFHGTDTTGVIGIVAPSADALRILLPQLPAGIDWKAKSEGGRHGVHASLTRSGVDKVKEWLDPLRCDDPCTLFDCHPSHRSPWKRARRHDIDGCEHSIDYGPRFEFSVPFVDVVTPHLPFGEVRS